jgi:hypothetical protein
MDATKYNADFQNRYAQVWSVQSETRADKVYTVAEIVSGAWSCSCPRWTKNSARPECKHIRHVKTLAEMNVTGQTMPEPFRSRLTTFAAIEV